MLYCRTLEGKWTNRGFLFGPYCPIYGFGSLLIIYFLENFKSSPVAVFFLGMLFTSILEYVTSYILEKMFNAKWWDYSQMRFNINGRVCLLNSTEFAVLGLGLTYIIHPFISGIVTSTPVELCEWIAVSLMVIMAIDCSTTIAALLNFKEKLALLHETAEGIRANAEKKLSDFEMYKELSGLRAKLIERSNFQIKRILDAFPDFEFKDFKKQLNEFRLDLHKFRVEKLNLKYLKKGKNKNQ